MNNPNVQGVHIDRAKTNYLSKKLAGQPVTEPPFNPQPGGSKLTAGVGALLRGAEAGSLTPAEEADARSQIEQMGPDILSAAEDSTDPRHALAHKVLQSFIAFAGAAS
jgi:hypothetical protein